MAACVLIMLMQLEVCFVCRKCLCYRAGCIYLSTLTCLHPFVCAGVLPPSSAVDPGGYGNPDMWVMCQGAVTTIKSEPLDSSPDSPFASTSTGSDNLDTFTSGDPSKSSSPYSNAAYANFYNQDSGSNSSSNNTATGANVTVSTTTSEAGAATMNAAYMGSAGQNAASYMAQSAGYYGGTQNPYALMAGYATSSDTLSAKIKGQTGAAGSQTSSPSPYAMSSSYSPLAHAGQNYYGAGSTGGYGSSNSVMGYPTQAGVEGFGYAQYGSGFYQQYPYLPGSSAGAVTTVPSTQTYQLIDSPVTTSAGKDSQQQLISVPTT
ncbi:hypothetical protein BaRGS_00006498 [Batillaria attramentaria]|uniref:Uncharacterized protein n=1 Tax=Batillaria attramentaria TaxID=370345 RepID=A0ABD0LSZ6_9CAEN